jgi:tetratricopeptide (TPR) repeat protein
MEIELTLSADAEDRTEYDWFGEARCQETSGDNEAALAAYSESIKLNPKFAKAWYYKALLHYELGQKEEALACAKKALEIKPDWEKHIRKNLPDLEI